MPLRFGPQHTLFALIGPGGSTPYFCDRGTFVQTLDEGGAQALNRLIRELGRVLEVVASDREEMLGGEFRVLSFPGNERSEPLPAGHSIHFGCAAFRTQRDLLSDQGP